MQNTRIIRVRIVRVGNPNHNYKSNSPVPILINLHKREEIQAPLVMYHVFYQIHIKVTEPKYIHPWM